MNKLQTSTKYYYSIQREIKVIQIKINQLKYLFTIIFNDEAKGARIIPEWDVFHPAQETIYINYYILHETYTLGLTIHM